MTMAHESGPGRASATPLSPSRSALPAPQPTSPDELLGTVTALYLKDQLVGYGASAAELGSALAGEDAAGTEGGENVVGTARFMVDRLSALQATAIARAILADP